MDLNGSQWEYVIIFDPISFYKYYNIISRRKDPQNFILGHCGLYLFGIYWVFIG